jgi:signal transduction histidine kinase
MAKRMHWLVNNLLSIARIDAGSVKIQRETIALDDVLAEWWTPFAARAQERRLRVTWNVSPGAAIETDREFLHVVVSNLMDNAVCYTPAGGAVQIDVPADGSISIANTAVDLKPELAQHVFDPFWRHSETREEVGTHAGIGLSLCRKIIEMLGGQITARISPEGNLFTMRLEVGRRVSPATQPTGSRPDIRSELAAR